MKQYQLWFIIQKTIEQFSYYVPTTFRIDENESLKVKVQTILSYVQSKIHLLGCSNERWDFNN